MKILSKNRFSRGSSWLLIIYLSVIISGCANRPAELPPEQARVLQTRNFNGSPGEVAKAISMVLQEMHYTVDNVDMDLGILTASRTSEHLLAPISREMEAETANDFEKGLGTFCIIAGTIAVVGLFFAWIFDVFDDDNDNDKDKDQRRPRRSHRSRSHHNESNIFIGGESSVSGPDSYTYIMTVNLEDLSLQQTRVRLTVQGEHYEGPSLVESGPVQDQQFYIDFFTRLQTTLNR